MLIASDLNGDNRRAIEKLDIHKNGTILGGW